MERLLLYYSVPRKSEARVIWEEDVSQGHRGRRARDDRPRVAVVGAGIAGVTSAYRISQTLRDAHVTVVAAHLPPYTTSDHVAGLWTPYLFGKDQDPQLIRRWAKETFDQWDEYHHSSDASALGISKLSGLQFRSKHEGPPFWKDIAEGYRLLGREEVRMYGSQYCEGDSYTAFTCESKRLSPFLLNRFLENGGELRQRRIDTLSELYDDYDVIINCTGVEAFHVTPDPTVYPIRGQVMRVRAPWFKQFLMDEDNYFIPNMNSVLIGGTHQVNDWSVKVRSKDSQHIWDGCCRMQPSLKNAEILFEWVGLRPGRSAVRLDMETVATDGKMTQVIHNYGHGGSGLTLCWGCAGDVQNLLHEHLRSRRSYTAKL